MSRPPRKVPLENKPPVRLLILLAVLACLLVGVIGFAGGFALASYVPVPRIPGLLPIATATPRPTSFSQVTPQPTPTAAPVATLPSISPPPLPFSGEPIATPEPLTHGNQP